MTLEVGGPVNDQGHMQSALINEITMTALAVVTKPFAVIGGEYDQRFLQNPMAIQERQKIPQHPVYIRQLRCIPRFSLVQVPAFGEIIGCVQVVQMKKHKEWRTRAALHPALRGIDD